ncbi:MAG: helix-turn-helix transcriptional regulator [Ginsengibacter sp.]
MESITFDQLPLAVTEIRNELYLIKKLLTEKRSAPTEKKSEWLSLPELCEYLPGKPSKPTIYGYVATSKIPFHRNPGSRILRFKKSEIDAWLELGSNKTASRIESETDQYLHNKKSA